MKISNTNTGINADGNVTVIIRISGEVADISTYCDLIYSLNRVLKDKRYQSKEPKLDYLFKGFDSLTDEQRMPMDVYWKEYRKLNLDEIADKVTENRHEGMEKIEGKVE